MVNLSEFNKKSLGKLFDYSVLPKYVQEKDIRLGCKKAIEYNCAAFYSSTTFWAPIIKEELSGTDILIGSAIDFPFGASTSKIKAFETEYAVKIGCDVVDITINIGALKDKKYDILRIELKDFKEAAGSALTKAILEVCFLNDDEIKIGCELIREAEIDYAKTSSGQFEGPSMGQFLLMRNTLKDSKVKLKVAGVKFPRPQNAYAFLMAGADLIGTRAAPEIIDAIGQMREIGIIPEYKNK